MLESQKQKLIDFSEREKRMPTYTEAMKIFGYKSKNAVAKVFKKLIDEGFVKKDKLGRLQQTNNFNEIPLLGTVTAGLPVDVSEQILDTLSLDTFLVRKKTQTYLLEVDGDSMIDAHIDDGDMVIAEVSSTAKIGDIVIAEVDGEWTMKYYREKNGKPYLEPANKRYKPIYPQQSFSIGAVVKGVVRKY